MTTKTFKYVGVSTSDKGVTKIRFANDASRVKVLLKCGHDDIDLRELPSEMQKPEAVAYLMARLDTFEPEGVEAVETANDKYNVVKVRKPRGKAKVTTVTAKTETAPADKAVDPEQAKRDKRNARRRELRALARQAALAAAETEA